MQSDACEQTLSSFIFWGLLGRVWGAFGPLVHSVANSSAPPPPNGYPLGAVPHYLSTWPRVSGNLSARKLPAARAPDANRMGTALVMPTKEVKILIPKTAANLQRALRNPNAVVLEVESGRKNDWGRGRLVTVEQNRNLSLITRWFKQHLYMDWTMQENCLATWGTTYCLSRTHRPS